MKLSDMLLSSKTMQEILCPLCEGTGVDNLFFEEPCPECDGGGTVWIEKSTARRDPVCSYLEVYERDGAGDRKRYVLTNPHVILDEDRDFTTEFHIQGLGKLLVRGWGVNPDNRERFFICYVKEKENKT